MDSCFPITVKQCAEFGAKRMKKAKIHAHFFEDSTFFTTALHLILFQLKFPYEYHNPRFLNHEISKADLASILQLFGRRIVERIPVEYITHQAIYLGNQFYVNPHVLVPRSLMNSRFKDFLNEMRWDNFKILDLCSGSGCIGISLALMDPRVQVDLSDISIEALKVAQINIDHYALNDRVKCVHSNLFENIREKYDLIISNPPYVSEKDYHHAPAEFKNEPAIALQSGEDGLTIIHEILNQFTHYLNPKGNLIVEVGFPSAKLIKRKYRHLPFTWYKYRPPSGKIPWLAMDCVFKL